MFANHSESVKPIDLQFFAEGDPAPEPAPAAPVVPADPATPATPQAEEFDVIKHNHQEVKLPVAERQAWLQKGYDYDNVRTERDTLKQQTAYIDRLAKMSGYPTTEAFLKAVEGLEEETLIQTESQRLGLDAEAYRQHIAPTNQKVSQLESEVSELRDLKVDVQLNELGIQDKELRSTIKEMVKSKGYSIQDAYKIATYDSVGKNKEQEILANITRRDNNQVLPSNDPPGNLKLDPKTMSAKDINEISRRVQAGERIVL